MPFVDNGVEVVWILNRFAIYMNRHLSLVKLEFTNCNKISNLKVDTHGI